MRKISVLESLLAGVLVLFLAACSGEKLNVPEIPDSADPTAEISRAQTDMDRAQLKEIDVLAPRHFSESKNALNKAKDLRANNESNKDVLSDVALSYAYLNRARELADASRPPLKDVLNTREVAIREGAPKYFKDDFQNAEEKLLTTTLSMEKYQEGIDEKNHTNLLKIYEDLKVNSIQEATMGDSLKVLDQAKNEGAEKWAPNTLAKTETDATQLTSLIHDNPNEMAIITARGEHFKNEANQLLRITRQSKLIDARNPEDVALRMDKQKQEVAALQSEAGAAERDLNHQKEKVANLESDAEFNNEFKKVSASFSPHEAEVFRTDHKIMIRLKGLHFPVAGTAIASQDYPLLKKVATALERFKGSQVKIEGHTDSSGTQATNLELSEKRAKAVKDYLVTNGTVPEQSVKAEGKGFASPVASNRTKRGRAENRRVDIIIQELG